jgi:hypothetical protein
MLAEASWLCEPRGKTIFPANYVPLVVDRADERITAISSTDYRQLRRSLAVYLCGVVSDAMDRFL